jgi:hypothetical protein
MIQQYVCAGCGEPALDTPRSRWTHPNPGGGWRHLDDTPLCPPGRPTLIETPSPDDPDTTPFTRMLADLFNDATAHDPARLFVAAAAVTSVTRYLRTATGPYSAELTLPDTTTVEQLLGQLLHTGRATTTLLANLMRNHVADRARRHLAAAACLTAESAEATADAWHSLRTIR